MPETSEQPLAALALAAIPPPTADDIDAAIDIYEVELKQAREAKERADNFKDRLIFLVDKFGQVPDGAKQSKRLIGRHNEATVTWSTSLQVDEDAVGDFENYLDSKGHLDLFPRFFSAETKHRVVDGARDVLKTLDLSKRIAEKLLALFGRAIEVKTASPSLKVKAIKPEKPAKSSRGIKAAA